MIAVRRLAILASPMLLSAFMFGGCSRLGFHRGAPEESVKPRSPPVALGPATLELSPTAADRSRIVLDQATLARLKDSAQRKTPAFVDTLARADEALTKPIASGYQGFEWADSLASLALLWHATGDARYADGATRYLNALLDDRFNIGDQQGGENVVHYDSGYGMRTFGAYSALAYDWLRGAPGMDAALRARVRTRLGQWLDWYGKEGYLRDHPLANYYWGYLSTLTFAGLAVAGDDAQANAWMNAALSELSKNAIPELNDELRGGGWPEGWQYGEYSALEIALVAQAWRTGAGINVASKLPWFGQTVTQHAHALLPDERTVYDGGTWGEHPARPSALAMSALSIALDGVDDARAAEARWLVTHALPPLRREQVWVQLLAERPGAPEHSPRADATSLFIPGQGLTFARSDWSRAAVWASFQAGPRLAEDHQDADQGHFELFRGSDGLLVDGGGSEGSATINHNTLLIDDGGKVLNYAPNQGVWGTKVKTSEFDDDGTVAVAVGEIGEAYAPSCARDGCRKRSVDRATRSFVYVRPSLLVIDDQIELERADIGATWAVHLTQNPSLSGDLASAQIGSSRVDVRTIEPREAPAVALREPTPSADDSHRLDQPWGPMWRLEVPSPTGKRERSFLHFITAGPAAAQPPSWQRLAGAGFRGALGRLENSGIAVLFSDPSGDGHVPLAAPLDIVVIAGLVPGKHYSVTTDSSCTLRLAPADGTAGLVAGRGGFVRLKLTQCGAKP
ncbi:MAG TPA: alginate lyase family protein [Polyangiaceae bacterium]|jgi:hypothetical protein|nr:alginate lyase family protein [Polyangiaceae bacterium]